MQYASTDLKYEHDSILFALKVLERVSELALAGRHIDPEDVREILDFLHLFADQCHHGKEECFLFPAMEEAGIPYENGPLGQMLLEHDEGRRHIAAMEAALKEETLDNRTFSEAARKYILLVHSHIHKENQILFPMGDERIPAEEQESLINAQDKFENEVMGSGAHQRLYELLQALQRKYLKKY